MSLAFDEPNLETLVRERIERWREGGAPPDAEAFLGDHPELRQAKSLVLDLILEEYCLRTEAGDAIAKSTFCERFPAYRQSVAKMLALHELLDQCPPETEEAARAHWPQAGDRFFGFDIVRHLGRGSLARVYLAREAALGGRTVVIKVSRYGAQEAETLGKLLHPNIVPIHSVRHEDRTGWTVICMPWLGEATAVDLFDEAFSDGSRPTSGTVVGKVARAEKQAVGEAAEPAGKAQARREPYEDAVARLVLQLAEALAHAHEQGVLHRDIKPSNILLARTGKPMLLDFNLATDERSPSARIGGTLAYMAPELIASLLHDRGVGARRFDPRCDIYSLGTVFFELLAGQLPARPANADQLPHDAYQPWLECKRKPFPALSALVPNLDPRLCAIVERCLASNPAERYGTTEELADALRAYLGLSPALGRLLKRNFLWVLLGLFVSLGAGGGIAYSISIQPTRETQLYEQGLAHYERGDFAGALNTFTSSLERKPYWPDASFARGQTHRQLKQWSKARADFMALCDTHPAWAYQFAGFCSLQAGDEIQASLDYEDAYQAGARDIGFLFNYLHVLHGISELNEADNIATEILRIRPADAKAIEARALIRYAIATNARKVPDEAALADARIAGNTNANSFESAYLASRVFAYAASKDAQYREEATRWLTVALQRGLPRQQFEIKKGQFLPLVNPQIVELLAKAPAQNPAYQYGAFHRSEPNSTADWQLLLNSRR